MITQPFSKKNLPVNVIKCSPHLRTFSIMRDKNFVLQLFFIQSASSSRIYWLYAGDHQSLAAHDKEEGYVVNINTPVQQTISYDPTLLQHPGFVAFLTTSGHLNLSASTSNFIHLLLSTMCNEAEGSSAYNNAILSRYLKIVFVHMFRAMETMPIPQRLSAQVHIVTRFQQLLEKEYPTKKSVADYAAALQLSANYLNTVVKAVTQQTASCLIKQRIALEAKRMAAYSDRCMKQVAYDLGFSDIPQFSKYFKAATGMNFTSFKEQNYLGRAS